MDKMDEPPITLTKKQKKNWARQRLQAKFSGNITVNRGAKAANVPAPVAKITPAPAKPASSTSGGPPQQPNPIPTPLQQPQLTKGQKKRLNKLARQQHMKIFNWSAMEQKWKPQWKKVTQKLPDRLTSEQIFRKPTALEENTEAIEKKDVQATATLPAESDVTSKPTPVAIASVKPQIRLTTLNNLTCVPVTPPNTTRWRAPHPNKQKPIQQQPQLQQQHPQQQRPQHPPQQQPSQQQLLQQQPLQVIPQQSMQQRPQQIIQQQLPQQQQLMQQQVLRTVKQELPNVNPNLHQIHMTGTSSNQQMMQQHLQLVQQQVLRTVKQELTKVNPNLHQIRMTDNALKKNEFSPVMLANQEPLSRMTLHVPRPAGIPRSFYKDLGYSEQSLSYREMIQLQQLQNAASQKLQLENAASQQSQLQNAASQQSPRTLETIYFQDGQAESTEAQEERKRVSAFERLGPLQPEPKRGRLTINLQFSKEQTELLGGANSNAAQREVVEEPVHVPVYLRPEVTRSSDPVVSKFLELWPWRMPVRCLLQTTASRNNKEAMLDQLRAMQEHCYDIPTCWVLVTVKGYPAHFKKEDILDFLLAHLGDIKFVPCFIECTKQECMFLVLKSRAALTLLHTNGLVVNKDDIVLHLQFGKTPFNATNLPFVTNKALNTALREGYDRKVASLDLSQFYLRSDNSHFMYFPLSRVAHQHLITQVHHLITWSQLVYLNLSNNRLTTVKGFNLYETTPCLKVLDLSKNLLPSVSTLSDCRALTLRELYLEENPLCLNFMDPNQYVDTVRLLFPRLEKLDDIKLRMPGVPEPERYFCPPGAQAMVEQFLETFFPLMDSSDRGFMMDMYSSTATFSITSPTDFRRNPLYRNLRDFFSRCRSLVDGEQDVIVGGRSIAKAFTKWPLTHHDPYTFTVDVLHHEEMSMVLKVTGLMKIPSESLAQDEPIAEFSRTLVLLSEDGSEYKIANDMMYIDEAEESRVVSAFRVVRTKPKIPSLQLDNAPDEDLKEKLITIFIKLTNLKRQPSERCLEMRNWDFRGALEYFTKLEKVNGTSILEEVHP